MSINFDVEHLHMSFKAQGFYVQYLHLIHNMMTDKFDVNVYIGGDFRAGTTWSFMFKEGAATNFQNSVSLFSGRVCHDLR